MTMWVCFNPSPLPVHNPIFKILYIHNRYKNKTNAFVTAQSTAASVCLRAQGVPVGEEC